MPARPALKTLLANAESGILLLGITPPRRSNPPERIREIADLTVKRLAGLDLDGLVPRPAVARRAAGRPAPGRGRDH